jgi:ABC-type transport system involved in cytochrome bd biosynthesis fused ATPase/permease subunit
METTNLLVEVVERVEKVEKVAEVVEEVAAVAVVVVVASLHVLFVISRAIMLISVIMLKLFASILKITSENQIARRLQMTNRLSANRPLDYLFEDHAP